MIGNKILSFNQSDFAFTCTLRDGANPSGRKRIYNGKSEDCKLSHKITISSIVIGLKNFYLPVIRLPSCYRTVWAVCYWTVCYRTAMLS